MTPTVKIPTIAVFDTQPTARIYLTRLNTLPAPLCVSDAADVAQMRPMEPRPVPVFAVPGRPYSEALRGIGQQVLRVMQPYK